MSMSSSQMGPRCCRHFDPRRRRYRSWPWTWNPTRSKTGTVASLAHPGGTITGLFLAFPDFTMKWLELLKETIPQLAMVAVLWDPATGTMQKTAIEHAAKSLDLKLDILEVRIPADFAGAFVAANERRAGAVLMLSSPLFGSSVRPVAELALHEHLPAVTL